MQIRFNGAGIRFEDTEEKQHLGLQLKRQSAVGHTFKKTKKKYLKWPE